MPFLGKLSRQRLETHIRPPLYRLCVPMEGNSYIEISLADLITFQSSGPSSLQNLELCSGWEQIKAFSTTDVSFPRIFCALPLTEVTGVSSLPPPYLKSCVSLCSISLYIVSPSGATTSMSSFLRSSIRIYPFSYTSIEPVVPTFLLLGAEEQF